MVGADVGRERGTADELAFRPAYGRFIPPDGGAGLVPANTLASTLVTWIAPTKRRRRQAGAPGREGDR
jgi:hypothetical protein